MVACLLDPAVEPAATERQGLEAFLLALRQQRDAQYTTFRQHWYSLQAQDFRSMLLTQIRA